ncbi:MAG: ChrR family anti-sigma-E factor [Pseudomonadota bacterium]
MNVLATRQSDFVAGLLAEYALGSLSKPISVLVESHLELSGSNRGWMSDIDHLESIFEQDSSSSEDNVLSTINPSELQDPAASLDVIFSKIDGEPVANECASSENQADLPRPSALETFIGMPLADVPWKKVMPGLAEYKLVDVDGCEASLLRIDGGKSVPVHTHHGSEITVVLQGGFSDGNGHYAVGDIAYADDEINHKPVADPGEVCICFAVVDEPVELTGPIGRFVNSLRR